MDIVETLTGKTIKLEVDANDNIWAKIAANLSALDQQRLILTGKRLANSSARSDYTI